MIWRVEYLESVVHRDIPKLSSSARIRIREAIESKLASRPVEIGKPLRYSFKGARRIRVGDYRVIYRVERPDRVVILKIGHRREVYR